MRKNEKRLNNIGFNLISGTDEAGRGPVAGPVVAASVILNNELNYNYINDSKQLSEKKRIEAYNKLKKEAISISYIIIDNNKIDEINILEATKLAMIKSIESLKIEPEFALIDQVELKEIDIPTLSIIKGDKLSKSIAAASIVAKVVRDELMYEYDKIYPNYDFKNNKGYLTKKHREAIKKYGPIEIHRKTFEPIKSYYNKGSK